MNARLRQLQKIELDILVQFDIYCKMHGLCYYLIGGALFLESHQETSSFERCVLCAGCNGDGRGVL